MILKVSVQKHSHVQPSISLVEHEELARERILAMLSNITLG